MASIRNHLSGIISIFIWFVRYQCSSFWYSMLADDNWFLNGIWLRAIKHFYSRVSSLELLNKVITLIALIAIASQRIAAPNENRPRKSTRAREMNSQIAFIFFMLHPDRLQIAPVYCDNKNTRQAICSGGNRCRKQSQQLFFNCLKICCT